MAESKHDLIEDHPLTVAVEERQNTKSSIDPLNITTNMRTYKLGQDIVITIKNNAGRSLTFSDAALGLRIKNVGTGESFGLVSAQVITELGPGISKTIRWNTGDSGGQTVKPGRYIATVITGSFSASTDFVIESISK